MKRIKVLSLIALALLVFDIYIWSLAMRVQTPERLRVSFLDVGQGDAVLIRAPNGVDMLIDGGRGSELISELSHHLPLGDTSIDIVLATHSDADHIGGLPALLESYEVGTIITNGKVSDTLISREFQKESQEEGATQLVATQGMRIILDAERNIYFDVLWPKDMTKETGDANDLSVVGRLIYGEREFLLTGDATIYSENEIAKFCRLCLSSDVLKVGHHGSRTSSGQSFLSAVASSYAVVSAGRNNSYGHPHREVVDRLEAQGMKVLTTGNEGSIIFETDGKELWLR